MKLNSYKIPDKLQGKEKTYLFSQHFGITITVILIFSILYFEKLISTTIWLATILTLLIIVIIHFNKENWLKISQ